MSSSIFIPLFPGSQTSPGGTDAARGTDAAPGGREATCPAQFQQIKTGRGARCHFCGGDALWNSCFLCGAQTISAH